MLKKIVLLSACACLFVGMSSFAEREASFFDRLAASEDYGAKLQSYSAEQQEKVRKYTDALDAASVGLQEIYMANLEGAAILNELFKEQTGGLPLLPTINLVPLQPAEPTEADTTAAQE